MSGGKLVCSREHIWDDLICFKLSMFFKKTNKFIIHYLMQLEPSSIACTDFGFAYCNKWSEKTFCTLLNQSKSKANPVTTWLPTFFSSFTCKWFAFFNFKSSNCLSKVLLSNLIGQRSYVTFFYIKELNTSQFWGWLLSWKDVFFHLVNVKVHFRGRLELSLESICSFRPHKIPLFMLWKGSNKGYQDK